MNLYSWMVVCTLSFFSCTYAQDKENGHSLTPQEFKAQLQQTPDAQLIDVRSPEEFSGGYIAKAHNINISSPGFDSAINTLDKSKPVFVYCLSGGRSAKAADKLTEKGFRQVYQLQGGLLKWKAAGLPEAGSNNKNANNLTLEDFKAKVQHGVVLVDFYANWCGPCKTLSPIVEKVVRESNGKVTLLKINVDKNETLTQTLRISSIPVLMLFKEGKLTWQTLGLVDEATIREQL